MKTDEYDFTVPEHLIAQKPAKQRSDSRMLVYYREDKRIEDHQVTDLPEILNKEYHLVFNNSKVIPSRLTIRKRENGREGELLILKILDEQRVIALTDKNKKYKPGEEIVLPYSEGEELVCGVVREVDPLRREFYCERPIFTIDYLNKYGKIPLPPYIRKIPDEEDKVRYQTIYSQAYGSAAAPTAGLHFDKKIFSVLDQREISYSYVTLHVGLGTFQPIYADTIEAHQIHEEEYEMTAEETNILNRALISGKKILPVGTTSLRTLESNFNGVEFSKGKSKTHLYITPGYTLKIAGGLFTNFHTPKSSLAVLVSAITGFDEFKRIYSHAIEKEYRFFSYGDCMLIL